jgi:replication-associated recombination protein RarA
LQKAIRRGQVDDAAYWAMEMFDRYPHHLWRRLNVIVSEDVGIAEPMMPAVIHALYATFKEQRSERHGDGGLPTMHAVILMAKARKSRMVNNALIVHATADDTYRDVPDVALDRHTKRGREMGRGMTHFAKEAALLADPASGELSAEGALPDPYLDRARTVLT